MRKRPWLIWLALILIFTAGGLALWLKMVVAEQPQTHEDPGAPERPEGLLDPEDVE